MTSLWLLASAALIASASAALLADICNVAYVQAALPVQNLPPGVTIDASSVSTDLTTNATFSSSWYPTATIDYCNATFSYSHDGLAGDIVHVSYWLPDPADFKNRYLSTGGGGYAINSGKGYIPSGVIVGAVSGITDGGYGNFNTQWNRVVLLANGTIDWQSVVMQGYQAHHELVVLGKLLTKNLYNVSDKVYSYYQGCSEGGREGWSQLQRFADAFDGAVTGAPAFHYGQLQVGHLIAGVTEKTLGYYPPTCELAKIANLTMAACDALDGRTDGVVSRSDLCQLHFDINGTVGQAYSCPASAGNPQMGSPAAPAQNGTVTAQGVAVARAVLSGLHDSQGQLVWIQPQPGATFADASTAYNAATGTWGPIVSGLGGEWIAKLLGLRQASNIDLSEFETFTYDTLKNLTILGMNKYMDSLQTSYPDLTATQGAGTKILHIHGEQDNSIPTGSSVYYYESVRRTMYGHLTYNDSTAALDKFYRLFLVPGGAHCSSNPYQPKGGWPQTTLQTVIDWVENGAVPDTLKSKGEIDTLCRWPLRPFWTGNGTTLSCVYDQASLDTWKYNFTAYRTPFY